jgi:hypothetical protein
MASVDSPASMNRAHERKSSAAYTRDSLVAVLAILLTLGIIEAGMRAAAIKYSGSFFTEDAMRGYAFRPGAAGWYAGDNRIYLRINREGYHDIEHTLYKPPGVIRIAIVGSSYVAAPDVPTKKNFVFLLQRDLQSSVRGLKVETLNFGETAYSPPQSFITLEKDVWKYKPDIVVFAITNVDIIDTCREIAVNTGFANRPYFDVDAFGNVEPDALTLKQRATGVPRKSSIRDQVNDWMNRSELALALHQAYIRRVADHPGVFVHRDAYHSIPAYEEALMLVGPPRNGPVEHCWRVLEALMPELRRAAERHGAELWILPIGLAKQDNPNASFRENYLKTTGAQSFSYYLDRISEMAKSNGIQSIGLEPALASYAITNNICLHGFLWTKPCEGHWNEAGNQAAAQIIAAQLLKESRLFAQR